MRKQPVQQQFSLTGEYLNAEVPTSGPAREECITRAENVWKALPIPHRHDREDIDNAATMLSAIAFSDFSMPLPGFTPLVQSPLRKSTRRRRRSLYPTTYIAPGTRVAALRDSNSHWFLATVVQSSTMGYVVSDEDRDEDEEDDENDFYVRNYTVPQSSVRTLSPVDQVFDLGERVIAVYPDTTTFYPATILVKKSRKWLVQFDDDTDLESDDGEGRLVDPSLILRS